MNVFTYLQYLFSGNSGELVKLTELNNIFKMFKSSKYKYILKDKIITDLFLSKMVALSKELNALLVTFESTIFAREEAKANIYLGYLIDSYLPKEIADKKIRFTAEAMWEKVAETADFQKEMRNIEDDFNLYKSYFVKAKIPKFDQEYMLLYKLYNLSTFNFKSLFFAFDTKYSPKSGLPPIYHPISGIDIIADLKDLYFLIASLPQKHDLTIAFNTIFSRQNEETARENSKMTINSINNVYKLISDELSLDKLLALCRYIEEDPKLKIQIEMKYVSILDKFKKEMVDRFNKNKELITRKYSVESQGKDIKELFKGASLMEIDGYRKEIAELISDRDLMPLNGIQAMRITKTFINNVIAGELKATINSLLIEGFFVEKEFQNDFSERFFNTLELVDSFKEFEDSITTSGQTSLKNLYSMLTLSSSSESKLSRAIEGINDKIFHFNKKCLDVMYNFASKLFLILQDYQTSPPARISNIKTLKGQQNKEFMAVIISGYNDSVKYCKIMKNLTKSEEE